MKSSARLTITDEDLRSPDFELPPKAKGPPIISAGIVDWALTPYIEGEKRKFVLTCPVCKKVNFASWPIPTSNFISHVARMHKSLLNNYGKGPLENGETSRSMTSSDKSRNSSKRAAGTSFPLENPNQTYANKRHKGNVYFDLEGYKTLLFKALISTDSSFSFVDDPSVKELFLFLNKDTPTHVSRKTMREHLNMFYDMTNDKLRSRFANNTSQYALTLDEWKASNNLDFLAVTVHYHDENFDLLTYTIGFENLNKKLPYSGEILFDTLIGVLTECNLKHRIISITRDNAGPINVLLDKFTNDHNENSPGLEFIGDTRCVGHVFNLSTTAFLKCLFFTGKLSNRLKLTLKEIEESHPQLCDVFKSVKSLPDIVTSIVHGLNHQTYLKNAFKAIVARRKAKENTNVGPEILVKNNSTRWLSTFKMLDRFIHFRSEIMELLASVSQLPKSKRTNLSLKVYNITDFEWDYLITIRDILKVFQAPTLQLQSSTETTISLTIPIVHEILKQLEAWEIRDDITRNPLIAYALAQAKRKLLDYYPLRDFDLGSIKNLYISTILDPRLKMESFRSLGLEHTAVRRMENDFRLVYDTYKHRHESTQSPATGDSGQTSQREEVINSGSGCESSTETFCANVTCFEDESHADVDEVTAYLAETRIMRNQSIAEYWKSRKASFPIIFEMARDFLATPAMSAPSESLFSRIGDMVTKKRNRLSPLTIKKYAIVKSRNVIPPSIQKELDNEMGGDLDFDTTEESPNTTLDGIDRVTETVSHEYEAFICCDDNDFLDDCETDDEENYTSTSAETD